MCSQLRNLSAGLFGALLVTTSLSAQADNDSLEVSSAAISMEAALAIALTEVPGSVIEAELEDEDGKVVWEIEVATAAGTEMELLVDANSGEIISSQPDEDEDSDDD